MLHNAQFIRFECTLHRYCYYARLHTRAVDLANLLFVCKSIMYDVLRTKSRGCALQILCFYKLLMLYQIQLGSPLVYFFTLSYQKRKTFAASKLRKKGHKK